MGYITHKLDEIDIHEIMDQLQKAILSGRIGQDKEEVAYRENISSLSFASFKAGRANDYKAYDSLCDQLESVLEQVERMKSTINQLRELGPHFIQIVQLDMRRRSWSWGYNYPGSIGRLAEQRLSSLISTYVLPKDSADFVAREIIVNILIPTLPFDVQMNYDFLSIISIWGLTSSNFQFNTLVAIVTDNQASVQEYITRYARGSILTFVRKLSLYRYLADNAIDYMKRIDAQQARSAAKKQQALTLLQGVLPDAQTEDYLNESLQIVKEITFFRVVEDVGRRVCMDRFEDYLLRQMVCDSMYELGLLTLPYPLAYSEHSLVEMLKTFLERR